MTRHMRQRKEQRETKKEKLSNPGDLSSKANQKIERSLLLVVVIASSVSLCLRLSKQTMRRLNVSKDVSYVPCIHCSC